MKKFFVSMALFAAMFLTIACGDGDSACVKDCKSYGYPADYCKEACSGAYDDDYYADYVIECVEAGHSESDCSAWYFEK